MTILEAEQTEQKSEDRMNIIRSERSVGLIRRAVEGEAEDNLVNVSFMLAPSQRAVIQQLAKENRFSQGVIVRVILDEWMQNKLNGS